VCEDCASWGQAESENDCGKWVRSWVGVRLVIHIGLSRWDRYGLTWDMVERKSRQTEARSPDANA
jgi:hypothetical protein